MKIMTVFIDASAWLAITDAQHQHHSEARAYFEQLLENNAKLITNNTAVDGALNELRRIKGTEFARKFFNILDESILTINLRMDWISRRTRRAAINQFLKNSDKDLQIGHFLIRETLKRKKVDIIFSFDERLACFGLPVVPQSAVHQK